MDTGCLLKRCEMKRFFFFFLLLVILTAPPIASSFSSNFTAEDIWENAQKVVKVFNNEPYGNYAILENDKKVGVVARKEGQLTIAYRGARGSREVFDCQNYGSGPIHAGYFTAYDKFNDSLIDLVRKCLGQPETHLNDVTYHIIGHSRGTGFVPQTVESLLNLDIPPQNIRAVCFSPLKVYSLQKAQEYNQKFGDRFHLNFKAEEDTVEEMATAGVNFLKQTPNNTIYSTVGRTFTYKATDYQEFNQWVYKNPYIHLDPSTRYLKLFLSPLNWGAHMPEAYLLTAPNAWKSQ